jgi:hypothetical protein
LAPASATLSARGGGKVREEGKLLFAYFFLARASCFEPGQGYAPHGRFPARPAPLSSLGQLAEAAIDSPERVYDLFAQELRLADREILAVALLDTRFRLIKKEQISWGSSTESPCSSARNS